MRRPNKREKVHYVSSATKGFKVFSGLYYIILFLFFFEATLISVESTISCTFIKQLVEKLVACKYLYISTVQFQQYMGLLEDILVSSFTLAVFAIAISQAFIEKKSEYGKIIGKLQSSHRRTPFLISCLVTILMIPLALFFKSQNLVSLFIACVYSQILSFVYLVFLLLALFVGEMGHTISVEQFVRKLRKIYGQKSKIHAVKSPSVCEPWDSVFNKEASEDAIIEAVENCITVISQSNSHSALAAFEIGRSASFNLLMSRNAVFSSADAFGSLARQLIQYNVIQFKSESDYHFIVGLIFGIFDAEAASEYSYSNDLDSSQSCSFSQNFIRSLLNECSQVSTYSREIVPYGAITYMLWTGKFNYWGKHIVKEDVVAKRERGIQNHSNSKKSVLMLGNILITSDYNCTDGSVAANVASGLMKHSRPYLREFSEFNSDIFISTIGRCITDRVILDDGQVFLNELRASIGG